MNEIIKIQSGKDIFSTLDEETVEPRQVFGRFIYEGELSILFGDSNAGKSILANDIAFFVSGGGHNWDVPSPDIPTMYIDMEMTTKQFAQRYHNAIDYIPDTYTRVEVDASQDEDDMVFTLLRNKIVQMQALPKPPKFIVIDNITNGFGSIYSPAQMKRLIAELKTLKARWGLTILLIAHCPKRKKNEPITQDSLGGSKMLINFVDSAFAIANTVHDERIKYLKQIKVRTGEKAQDVFTVLLTEEPYLSFKPLGAECEECCISNKLSIDMTRLITPEQELKLIQMLSDGKMRNHEIADELELPLSVILQYKIRNRF